MSTVKPFIFGGIASLTAEFGEKEPQCAAFWCFLLFFAQAPSLWTLPRRGYRCRASAWTNCVGTPDTGGWCMLSSEYRRRRASRRCTRGECRAVGSLVLVIYSSASVLSWRGDALLLTSLLVV